MSACDPLDPAACYLPFPNNFWLRKNSDGVRVTAFANTTFPADNEGNKIDVDEEDGWNGLHGFAPMAPFITYFPNASIENCARLWDMGPSLDDSSPTVLLDMTTGKRVRHWVELDHSSDEWFGGESERMFMVWPAASMINGHDYAMAIRNIHDTSGSPVHSSTAFLALRDGTKTSNPDIEERRAEFEAMFQALSAAGVQRDDLQIAWPMRVGTQEDFTASMVSMRDQGLKAVDAGSVGFAIDSVQERPREGTRREVHGHMTNVPWYLNMDEADLKARLVRDPGSGMPVSTRTRNVTFTVVVPDSLATGGAGGGPIPGRVVQIGHGLFGSQSEVTQQYLSDEANEYGYVMGGVNWLGLCDEDIVADALMVGTDLSDFPMIPDRLHQGMLNALLLMRVMTSDAFVSSDVMTDFSTQTPGQLTGARNPSAAVASVIDPSKRNYYGSSLGGIMGSVYMTLSTDVSHGTLGVPGGPFSLLLPRSSDFAALFDVIRLRYDSSLDRISLMSALQQRWAQLEPSGYAQFLSPSQQLPGVDGPRRVLLHYGIGDAQVSWVAAHALGRSAEASMYKSNLPVRNQTIDPGLGFPLVDDSDVLSSGSLIQSYGFGVPD